MIGANLSGTLNIFRLLVDPTLCLPQATIPTFAHLRIPLSNHFPAHKPDIRAVVLDKDNCFAIPHQLEVYEPYSETFNALRAAYPGNKLLIVSNTAGTLDDKAYKEANLLTKTTSVPVLHHNTKKPGCFEEIVAHLRSCPDVQLEHPSQIAVVGDRLFTDVMMGNRMGAWSVYVKDGVDVKYSTVFSRFEQRLVKILESRGYQAPIPSST